MTKSFWLGLDGTFSRPKKKKEKEKTLASLGHSQPQTTAAGKAAELNWEDLLGRK